MGFTYRKEAGVYRLVNNMYEKSGGIWLPGKSLNHKVGGIFKNVYESEVVVTITTNQIDLGLINLFDSDDWFSNKNKRVVINAGVTISPSANSAAIYIQLATATVPWGGVLTLDNYGTIQGKGGAANSGVGGDAFYSGTYSNTGGKKLQVNNYGVIRAGGGGGGKGGTGGGGQYSSTATEGPYYARLGSHTYFWSTTSGTNINVPVWDNDGQGSAGNSNPRTVGIYTYYRVAGVQESIATDGSGGHIDYYRVQRTYSVNNNTSGGAGGNGGRGQGSDGALAAGSGGTAGGTNAGTGGTGGTGGNWGLAGATGFTGGSGNRTAGAVGTAGGAAGYAYRDSTTTFLVPGTILGRVA